MKIVAPFLLIASVTYAQTQTSRDSLVNAICETINRYVDVNDSLRIYGAYEIHLPPYLEKFPEATHEEIVTHIYYRLQRNCPEFKNILDRNNPPKGDWEPITDSRPETELSKKACRQFLARKHFFYLESTGDTVALTLDKGYWTDHFPDGTWSRLKFKWINDCEFEIEFIESNNTVRKNFSKPGDKYRYSILQQTDAYYTVSAEIVGSAGILKFKLYPKKSR